MEAATLHLIKLPLKTLAIFFMLGLCLNYLVLSWSSLAWILWLSKLLANFGTVPLFDCEKPPFENIISQVRNLSNTVAQVPAVSLFNCEKPPFRNIISYFLGEKPVQRCGSGTCCHLGHPRPRAICCEGRQSTAAPASRYLDV